MESLLFVDLTLSEEEKLSGGDSNMNTVKIMQSNSSGNAKAVVNIAWKTTYENGISSTYVSQSNSVTSTETNSPVSQSSRVTVIQVG